MTMTLPYYQDPKVLEQLQRKSKEDKIKWHTRRVQRERIVYKVMDVATMHVILDDKEINQRLERVRRDIEEIERHVKVREDSKFKSFHSALQVVRRKYLISAEESHSILLRYLKNRSAATLQILLTRLRNEENLLELGFALEVHVQDVCSQHGVPSTGYVCLSGLLERMRGPQMQQILKKHFGYSK